MAAVLEVPLVHRLVVLWLLCFLRVLVLSGSDSFSDKSFPLRDR